jgi:pSer/pThr/pTyr-binding forkhead associated (FHA) protein
MSSPPLPPPLPEFIPPAVLGELVLRTGRLNGTRRPLTVPLTLVGRAAGCDIRLNVEAVAPHHCAVVHTPAGFVLRDLGSEGGTLVNGAKATTRTLVHGDRLDIGPFQFEMALPDSGRPTTTSTLDAERETLRIQAAAVVAQQTALLEEETKLAERREALHRHEEQLSAHLDDNRRQLVDLREQVRSERDAWKAEHNTEEERLAARRVEMERASAEAENEWDRARKERDRCVELLRRLRHRWDERFASHEAFLKRRQHELDTRHTALVETAAGLERDRAADAETYQRHRAEIAQQRRELNADRQQWETAFTQERAEGDRRFQLLTDREEAVAQWAEHLARQQRAWEQTTEHRRKEAEGLETRINNQRLKLQALQQSLAAAAPNTLPAVSLVLPPTPVSDAPTISEPADAPVALKRLVGCLADQRLRLLEQWRGVLDIHELWQRQRVELLAELEETGQRQAERETAILAHEDELSVRAAELDERHQSLVQGQATLDALRARLTANVLEWETERSGVLVAVQDRERAVGRRVRRLWMICRRAVRRQRDDIESLRAAVQRHADARQQYVAAWTECRQRGEALLHEQQSAASEMLALEQLRMEVLGKSDNAAASEKRLEKLRRQNQSLAERDLERERMALRTEAGRLEERDQALRKDEDAVLEWKRRLAKRHVVLERRLSALRDEEEHRAAELQRLRNQHEADEKQLGALREEVERVARSLMNDVSEPPPAQAA